MMNLKIAIIEDDKDDLQTIKQYINQYLADRKVEYKIDCFECFDSFLKKNDYEYNLFFIDIQLPDANGMNIAFSIREKNDTASIIFETEIEKYAIKGYEVNAIGYLLKPVKYQAFVTCFTKGYEKQINLKNEQQHYIMVKTLTDGIIKVYLNEIKYIEVFGHNLIYHLNDKNLNASGTLNAIEKEIGQYDFYRCNSCYLVNASKITSINKYNCNLTDEALQISHPKRKVFVEQFKKYVLKKGGF